MPLYILQLNDFELFVIFLRLITDQKNNLEYKLLKSQRLFLIDNFIYLKFL